ncbi:CDP-alcohol phosphatidyltransferase family protein [Planotetraspora phitsanulokensis]|uniref:CDP-alcohol phosphatidyltransferase n=1 Tax=Planotetraspora phitsanulokensis TaxID=575192 RepID=A0A8J3U340_9ACTN|nr:CDP-alcohol phosphatidyltransferase family protein [Planotetraspora phitsanulokensis]GII37494.1 hypothetical protein Pph01_24970 [Planotetraspora phitsanulokensis]
MGLLCLLNALVGLSSASVAAGVVYTAGLWAFLAVAARRSGTRSLGPADHVTLARALLVGGVTALVAVLVMTDHPARGLPLVILVTLATVALILDAVDGQVARRTGTVSKLGARFDMEVDAFLILVLSVHVAGSLGAWVLVIGAMRYAFVVAGWTMPWLRGALPPSFARKVVAATQGIVLVVAASGVLPYPVVAVAVGAALASLVWSFGRDVVWLWRNRPARTQVASMS